MLRGVVPQISYWSPDQPQLLNQQLHDECRLHTECSTLLPGRDLIGSRPELDSKLARETCLHSHCSLQLSSATATPKALAVPSRCSCFVFETELHYGVQAGFELVTVRSQLPVLGLQMALSDLLSVQ